MREAVEIVSVIGQLINFYLILLTIRILLTWLPNIDWMSQPFAFLGQITDPYLNIFRSIIPPLGGIDFSPILGFLLLQFISAQLTNFAFRYMAYAY